MVLTGFLPVLTSLREKTFCRTLNCLFYRLLRALIGGQAYERASSGNVIDCPPDGRQLPLDSQILFCSLPSSEGVGPAGLGN
jgi:hypothetical protein